MLLEALAGVARVSGAHSCRLRALACGMCLVLLTFLGWRGCRTLQMVLGVMQMLMLLGVLLLARVVKMKGRWKQQWQQQAAVVAAAVAGVLLLVPGATGEQVARTSVLRVPRFLMCNR